MPDTLYASNPSVPGSPHPIQGVEEIPNGITPEQYYRALSRRPMTDSEDEETAESVFRDYISDIVQSKCVNCHVDTETAAYQRDRLVFVNSSQDDHQSQNFQEFADFVSILEGEDEDPLVVILGKIRGDRHHGGGRQVAADTEDYRRFEQFLRLLVGEEETASGTVTAQNLFDGVGLRADRKVLRQAALIFAGRIPTADEYASIGEIGLRSAIRNLMTGPGFHEFLIRASNDRLLTDREDSAISNNDSRPVVEYINRNTDLCEAEASGDSEMKLNAMRRWRDAAQFAAVRAPLELIAHVAENDLTYTEILTADYVMANPQAAEAYGADTEFADPSDVFEFRPSRFARYYLNDDSRVFREKPVGTDCQHYILDPGNLALDYPHAGILNSPVFMIRYPTTATNRNRARSRWTYYHFLGFDIEKSRTRTTDADALADTNNPTLNNPECTGCHTIMDPVAGTYQNYDEDGDYRQYDDGMNSLDGAYKRDPAGGEEFLIEARSYDDRQTVASEGYLKAGHNTIGLRYEHLGQWSSVGLATVIVRDSNGGLVDRYRVVEVGDEHCGGVQNEHGGVFSLNPGCVLGVPVDVTRDGIYTVGVEAWNWNHDGRYPGQLKVWVPGYIYQEGDTWYRDMLPPGFKSTLAPSNDDSVQWLAQQIVADDRFAEATVKFWWPALHGSEVSTTPPKSTDVNFEGRKIAAIAQDNEVERLAQAFREGINGGEPFNLKDLLVEMVLSAWFRAETMPDDDAVREVALLNAGAKRLLTPEELTNKTLALTGVQWDRKWRQPNDNPRKQLNLLSGELNILYGGIDSDGIIERGRDLTAVMAGVAKSHAVELSCPIVMRDLYLLPDDRRRLFHGIDKEISPTLEFSDEFEIEASSWGEQEKLSITGPLREGQITVNMVFTNEEGSRSVNVPRLRLIKDGIRLLTSIPSAWTVPQDAHGNDCGRRISSYFHLSSTCSKPLVAILQIPVDGTYTIEIDAFATQFGDELPRLAVSIESDTENSAGSIEIKRKLVELHSELLDVDLTIDSEEIGAAYDFYVDVWNRNQTLDFNKFYDGLQCEWEDDASFLEGILSDYRIESEDGFRLNNEVSDEFIQSIDFRDPRGNARTWTVVLMSMLMDQRYLHL